MDIIAVAGSVAGLITICVQISDALIAYARAWERVPDAIKTVREEIRLFSVVLASLRKSTEEPLFLNSARLRPVEQENWSLLRRIIDDSATLLADISRAVAEIGLRRLSALNADRICQRMEMHSRRIAAHRSTISNLSTMYAPFTSIKALTVLSHCIHLVRTISESMMEASRTDTNIQPTLLSEPTAFTSKQLGLGISNPVLDYLAQRLIEYATSQISINNYEAAQAILIQFVSVFKASFERRSEILELLATTYFKQERWKELEDIMLKVISERLDTSRSSLRLWGLFYALAVVLFCGDAFEKAERHCQKAAELSLTWFGDDSILYSKSVGLLLEIYKRSGKSAERNMYMNLLDTLSIQDHVERGDAQAVQDLLPLIRSKKERDSALVIAAYLGHETIFRLLLGNHVDVEAKSNNGQAVLIVAAKRGFPEIVKVLLEKGAYVDVADQLGETSLMLAAVHGHEMIVRLLLKNGADVTLKNSNGRTALELARLNGRLKIARLLRKPTRQGLNGWW